MILNIQPDFEKAKALFKMSLITIERLDMTKKEEYPTNTLIDYYDSIHKLLESLCFCEGIKIKGEGAHYELIEHISKKYRLEEKQRIFLQQMREYRNRISYEGFSVNKNYIEQNEPTIKNIIDKLTALLNIKLSQ